jgi:adenylyl-sulfate kinase
LALAPGAERWNDWASAQAVCSRPALAELGFRQALRIDPNDREACANLGALLCSLGRHAEALPWLERAEPMAKGEEHLALRRLIAGAKKGLGARSLLDAPESQQRRTLAVTSDGEILPRLQEQTLALERIDLRLAALEKQIAGLIAPGNLDPSFPLPARDGFPRRGFTVFLTGLSGAGKTTIAQALVAKLGELRAQPVTLLDGDLVRMHLSSELGFSREHRDINIRRIGFVASEITKCGAVAVCAVIAPFDRARRQARAMVEAHGNFFLVHVSTPLDVCEQRDPKGLYAKARAGIIPQFTGVSDPYEEPSDAEIRIDTKDSTPDDAAHQIVSFIARKLSLPASPEPISGFALARAR